MSDLEHKHGDCCCGHDHEHAHHHHAHEACGCGHDHEHEDCGCGHDHAHHHHEHHHHPGDAKCNDPAHPAGCLIREHDFGPHDRRVFLLEGLDCPNCAQKIEDAVSELPTVANVVVTYANLQMRVKASENKGLLNLLQTTIDSVEEGVTVVERQSSGKGSACVYILQGLDCPNCAQKIEDKLNSMPEIDEAVVTYANTQVRITARGAANMTEFLQKTIDQVEDGITVIAKEEAGKHQEPQVDPLKRSLKEILVGAVLFAVPFIASHAGMVSEGFNWTAVLFVIAYLVLGGKVLKTACYNLYRGQMFDENFLMAIATLGAFGLGVYSGSWEFDEAVGVMLFYRIGEFFEQKATAQSRSQIMDAVDLRPEVVNLCSGESVRVIKAEEAEVGDILLVRPGDRIPLDGVVIEGESRIDTSPVTGEPVPVKAGVGDSVVSGCVNTSGVLKIRVEKPLAESMVTRILDSVENAAASKPQIDKFITRFSRIYTPVVVISALVVAILPILLGSDRPEYWVTTALTFLVISCPCALVLSVPLAFFCGIGAGSKKGILFKGGIAIEALKDVKAVVMDKTGTVTQGNFTLQRVNPAKDSALGEDQILALAAACESSSTHPIGTSIVAAAREKRLVIPTAAHVTEIAGKGIRAEVDGKTVLAGNWKLLKEQNVSLSAYKKEGFGTEVLVAVDGCFVGDLMISDTIKAEARSAIESVKSLGIVAAMLTGDAQDSAEHVAAQTGIDEVHAKLLPQEKLTELQKIRQAHGSVLFVGDGINDAPVLAGADVGAAMGSGADAAIEAADVVFMTSSVEAIPQAIDIARATSRISWQNVYFALAVKVLVMALGLLGYANMWLAVFADTGVSMLCLMNAFRVLKRR